MQTRTHPVNRLLEQLNSIHAKQHSIQRQYWTFLRVTMSPTSSFSTCKNNVPWSTLAARLPFATPCTTHTTRRNSRHLRHQRLTNILAVLDPSLCEVPASYSRDQAQMASGSATCATSAGRSVHVRDAQVCLIVEAVDLPQAHDLVAEAVLDPQPT